jgi:hypothetical protein
MQPSSCAKARPRPSPFREVQKGGVLGNPPSSASFEFLFEGLRTSNALARQRFLSWRDVPNFKPSDPDVDKGHIRII